MATIDQPRSHRGELGRVVELAGERYAIAAVLLTLGLPLFAFLAGIESVMFYVHVGLGAFWFGFDFFFKFVLGPSLEQSPDRAVGAVQKQLVPKIIVVAEPLSVGVIGFGIGLAYLLGYWTNPTVWLWGALIIGGLMLANGFGPLHLATTRMAVELSNDEPDRERIGELFGKALRWGFLQTVFMLAILVMMVGMRGV